MEFVFRVSNYEDPALDDETVDLMVQRLEAQSRQLMPGLWQVTDHLNAYAAKGPAREDRRMIYRIMSILLMAVGMAALVSGISAPGNPTLVAVGILVILIGLLHFCMSIKKKPTEPPITCRQGAAALLGGRRAVDWDEQKAEVRFDCEGMVIVSDEDRDVTPYGNLTGVFETERLWMVVCRDNRAVLLQKKDLVSGEAERFLPDLQGKIKK